METMKIRAILTAVKEKSLSRAAEAFSYTPSALSHMTDALEEELGVKLLERTRTGVYLTSEGEELAERLSAVLEAEDALKNAAEQIHCSKSDTLRIGAYASISSYLLPNIVKKFKKAYPDVRVSITVSDEIRELLENGSVDVIFGTMSNLGENEKMLIMEEEYVALVPAETFSRRRKVSREELYSHTYISINENVLHEYFDEARFKELLRFDSVDDSSVVSLVKEGIGVAVLPSLAVQKNVSDIRILSLEPKITRAIGFAYKKCDKVTGYFVDFMKKQTL